MPSSFDLIVACCPTLRPVPAISAVAAAASLASTTVSVRGCSWSAGCGTGAARATGAASTACCSTGPSLLPLVGCFCWRLASLFALFSLRRSFAAAAACCCLLALSVATTRASSRPGLLTPTRGLSKRPPARRPIEFSRRHPCA